MRTVSTQVLSLTNPTGTNTSAAVSLQYEVSWAVQAVWTGTLAGTVSVNVSNDGVNWSPEGASATLGGAAGNKMLEPSTGQAIKAYQYVQVQVTISSGSGSIAANVAVKG